MIENAELVMQMLEMYQIYKQQVPVELEEYLRYVAKTGNTLFQWTLVKPFIREKILNVIAEFAEQSAVSDIPPYPNVDPFNYEAMKNMLLERFDTFNGPPFTIQRLCELLSCPRKEYSRVDKFMRAVEKNILVVSTCELRPKREETILNGVPDLWENGKESDINMDLEKNNVISDSNVLNGNVSIESVLNKLESMKTPKLNLDILKTEPKDNFIAQVSAEVESSLITEESKQDTQILIDNTPQVQITDSTEIIDQVNIDIALEPLVDISKEQNSEVSHILPDEIKEEIAETSVDELKDLSSDINLENIEPQLEEPIIKESNELDNNSELITADADRVEGSIIHQTPDSDNKVDLDVVSQSEIILDKSNEIIENMDVQTDDITKSMESDVSCDNEQECSEPSEIKSDKEEDKQTVDVVPAIDPIPIEVDTKPEKNESAPTEQETVLVNEESKTTEPSSIVEEPKGQDEQKVTESE